MARLIAVDTNILLRTLIDDEDALEQCEQARKIVSTADQIQVHAAVLLETAWLLSRSYRLPREQVVNLLSAVCEHPKILISGEPGWRAVIKLYAESNIDFADAAMLIDSRERGILLHTFDRKLGAQVGAALVSADSATQVSQVSTATGSSDTKNSTPRRSRPSPKKAR